MNNCKTWAHSLNILLENNFMVAKFYKRKEEQTDESHFSAFFQKQISKRSQFAAELRSEIKYLGCVPSLIALRSRTTNWEEDEDILLNGCINMEQRNIMAYKNELSRVNNGHSREILIRHLSSIYKGLEELSMLKANLIPDNSKREVS